MNNLTNYNSNTYATGATAEVSNSMIRDAVCGTEGFITDIHTALDALEQRLDTVVVPVPPNVAKNDVSGTPTVLSSHLLGRVKQINGGLSAVLQRLITLKNRVEV